MYVHFQLHCLNIAHMQAKCFPISSYLTFSASSYRFTEPVNEKKLYKQYDGLFNQNKRLPIQWPVQIL